MFSVWESPEAVKPMRRAKCHLHSEKNTFVFPKLSKEIVALVQPNAMERWHIRVDAVEKVGGQALGRNRTIFQVRDFVQKTMIELRSQGMQGRFDFVVPHQGDPPENFSARKVTRAR